MEILIALILYSIQQCHKVFMNSRGNSEYKKWG